MIGGVCLFIVNKKVPTKTKTSSVLRERNEEDISSSNQPPPHSPQVHKPNQKEDSTSERNKKINQLVSENEYLLKTNPRLVPIPDNYINELFDKGYNQAGDMRKLFDWKLTIQDIPNLNSTQRIGVIKGLGILTNKEEENNLFFPLQEQKGVCDELVVMVRESTSTGQKSPIINIDGRIWKEFEKTYFQEIITSVLTSETNNPNQWEVSVLYANGGGPFEGESGGTALYLALLSVLYKKPLPNNLASSGGLAVNENKVLTVGGLKGKITAAFDQGVRSLVLPKENSSPNMNEIFFTENYWQVVPSPIREKMIVYWVKSCQELKDLIIQNKLS